ncbi:MAG: type II toxin-antitoxin system HipA family toxin [Alphaproteobacteria bacterium]|nr:type II toxin-antitoxin system HipA family toxin [Alphaproteobacteria bacterium]
MSRTLDVYFDEVLAGKLTQDESGRLNFAYDSGYLDSKTSFPLSISLPLSVQIYGDSIVRPFFSNLLPDDLARYRVARLLGVSEKNPFAILEIIGRECAGAISLYPEGQVSSLKKSENYELLEGEKLYKILMLLAQRPLLAGEKDVRMSLAGAQDKLAVALIDNKIALTKGAFPTTHIIKPPISDIPESVFNEYFCMLLASRMNLPVAHVDIRWAENTPFLLVKRYDRTADHHHRLHQEDFCQALSIPPEFKYENEGGPSIKLCLDLIEKHSVRPALDRITFVRTVIFNYLIGNADAHAKNYSFLYKEGKPHLAPLYDLLSTAVYPQLSQKMAMKIGGKYKAEDVYSRHWEQLVPNTQLARNRLQKDLKEFAKDLSQASLVLAQELNSTERSSFTYKKIQAIIDARCQRILAY